MGIEEFKKELHKKHCDDCLNFAIGVCGGIQYHIPKKIEQPLCEKVKKKYQKFIKEN